MEVTYDSLLQVLVDTNEAEYRSDPEREDAKLEAIEYVLTCLLAKLAGKKPTIVGSE